MSAWPSNTGPSLLLFGEVTWRLSYPLRLDRHSYSKVTSQRHIPNKLCVVQFIYVKRTEKGADPTTSSSSAFMPTNCCSGNETLVLLRWWLSVWFFSNWPQMLFLKRCNGLVDLHQDANCGVTAFCLAWIPDFSEYFSCFLCINGYSRF